MIELDAHFAQLLHIGFVVMRTAFASGDRACLEIELEHLHNNPSLIGETNVRRHRYYWEKERTYYLERLTALCSPEASSRMRTFYEPTWNEMRPEMERIFSDE